MGVQLRQLGNVRGVLTRQAVDGDQRLISLYFFRLEPCRACREGRGAGEDGRIPGS